MIGYLSGEIFEVFDNSIIILVNGVGYKVFPTGSFLESAKKNNKSSLYITNIIKEDVFDLYGFEMLEERNLFELIIGISGIGPKTALAILSRSKIDEILNAISLGDAAFFTGIPRLGKKNAQKLIIELRSKVGDITPLSFVQNQEREELVQALKGFGYQERELLPIMSQIDNNGGKLEEKIAFALKLLGKK